MSLAMVIRGRYAGQRFIPSEPLPETEGTAELIIIPQSPTTAGSMFDLFGKAPTLRSGEDIAAQIREEHDAWGEA